MLTKSMIVRPLLCVKEPWTEEAVDAKWHMPTGRKQVDATETLDHSNVVKYFAKLTKAQEFRAVEKKYIAACDISWGTADDSDSDSDSA